MSTINEPLVAVRYRILGAIVAQRRAAVPLSQSELAAQVGASQSLISRLERGSCPLDMFLARKIATALGLTESALLGLVETALERTVVVVLGVCGDAARRESWWTDAEHIGGHDGLSALIMFAVAAVLAASAPPTTGGDE